MWIQALPDRKADQFPVEMEDGTVYMFGRIGTRHLAAITNQKHVDRLLAIGDYREAQAPKNEDAMKQATARLIEDQLGRQAEEQGLMNGPDKEKEEAAAARQSELQSVKNQAQTIEAMTSMDEVRKAAEAQGLIIPKAAANVEAAKRMLLDMIYAREEDARADTEAAVADAEASRKAAADAKTEADKPASEAAVSRAKAAGKKT